VVRGKELLTAYVHAKFEDRSFTRLRNIEAISLFVCLMFHFFFFYFFYHSW